MKSKDKKTSTAESIANTFEWIITAFVLAFVFRAFVLEAFRIPTGSMADTLMGDHFRLRCTQCGYKYEYNFDPYSAQAYRTYAGKGFFRLHPSPRCPSCGYYEKPDKLALKSNGDRILVFKSLYQFAEPKRWDVFVFKNPTDPKINYIKRLIGKPGETVEIIDGDVYIDGKLARRPARVQQEHWMPVYNNNFQPIEPFEGRFNNHNWHQPFTNEADSQWQWNQANPLEFTLSSSPDKINTLFYDSQKGNDFRATYGYDDPRQYMEQPYCSDLYLKFGMKRKDTGLVGVSLTKYETTYNASCSSEGLMTITKTESDNVTKELARKEISPLKDKYVPVSFSNVDHLLVFAVDGEKLIYDLGTEPNSAGEPNPDIAPGAAVFASGNLTIDDVQLYRDLYYTNISPRGAESKMRAGTGNPFTLNKDEFFACGDNSPFSYDSRLWSTEGIGNNGNNYRMGVVPRDYLVGKAFFVYWPGGFRPGNFGWAIIPNVGRMRFIYGGE